MFNASNDRLIHAAIKAASVITESHTGFVQVASSTPRGTESGYLTVSAAGVTVYAHRVMWLAHHPETPSWMQVNHINGRRWDNRLANLEGVLPLDNMRHGAGLPYVSVGDEDFRDDRLPLAWVARAMSLAIEGNATAEDISALKTTSISDSQGPQVFTQRHVSYPMAR